MTGRETLYLFARLRGIKEHRIAAIVEKLVDDLLLRPHIDRLAQSYRFGLLVVSYGLHP